MQTIDGPGRPAFPSSTCMPELTVRALEPGDELAGLTPVWGEPLDAADAAHSPAALVALRGAEVVGLALGRRTRPGWWIDALLVAGASPRQVLVAFARAHPRERIELLARDSGVEIEHAVSQAGFRELCRYVNVRGSLSGRRRPARRPLTFRGYQEIGRRGMAAALAAIWSGGPGPTGLAPSHELDNFLDLARPRGGVPDTSLWRAAYHAGELAGVVLALRLGRDRGTGVLLYIGVVPALRGRGLGGALHAEALWALRAAGALDYEDSTAHGNGAMRRIFERAGCDVSASSVLFAREPELEPERATPPAAPPVRSVPLGAHVSLLRKVPWSPGDAQRTLLR